MNMVLDDSQELGPALKTRTVLGDGFLWAIEGACDGVINYDVRGLSDEGVVLDPLLARGAKAVGRGVAGFAEGLVDAALGGEDGGDGKPFKVQPDFVVFGKSLDCLAIRYLDAFKSGTWALTPRGLVQVGFRDLPVEPKPEPPKEPEKEAPKSLLGKAIKFGKAVKDFVATDAVPDFQPPDPKPMVGAGVTGEIPAAHIAGFEVASRRWKVSWNSCFRLNFVDGSGWDMFILRGDREAHEWMLAMTTASVRR
ncbi:hypothetical protein SAMN05421504_10692 [Amycolatopsis xylanica]|uniref:Uncharacterized protein n=1 Tax=Amycolatopsis xylanica TaxID=589385 RepID=A0A1H3L7J1_9PSEU|nr:hypothetical protein [Amycolatopsis xylanica]SDY60169.1 hypothetical protein SAMN05421504_10692 [Amycolatopsis xylanica]